MKTFENILCVIDDNADSKAAVLQSLEIARDQQARITFASVIRIPRSWHLAFGSQQEFDSKLAEANDIKEAVIRTRLAELDPSGDHDVQILTGIGFMEIIKSVTRNHFDLVVKCAEDPDWLGRMFGSDDMHLLRKCPCPVLMLKPEHHKSIRNILATVDLSDDPATSDTGRVQDQINRKVLEYSASLCVSELTSLHIGTVWEAFGEDFERHSVFSHASEQSIATHVDRAREQCEQNMKRLLAELQDRIGNEAMDYIKPVPRIVKGQPSREIPIMADNHDIDLIVMGTVGRIGLPGLFIGNTAESILEQVRCSVLAIKPDGFQTPVL